MDNSKMTIKIGSGSYNFLDKKYNNYLKDSLSNIDEDTYERWITYDTIINELIWLGKMDYFEEIKYRLTGGEDPNEVMISIINKDNDTKTHMWPHLRRLKDYYNEDILKRFY